MKRLLLLLCFSAISFTSITSQNDSSISDYSVNVINETDNVLGDVVTNINELVADNQIFILKGNAVKFFTSASGTTFTGSGPLFMQCAENGDTEVNRNHAMQLIPYGENMFIVYWPVSKKFLQDSNAAYNGLNGWQYSTENIDEAAIIKISATDNGYFEMQYESTYNNNTITFHIGAELRDGMASKMKTFDPTHKQYLENGDYNQGFSLPIAFNWTIYKADIDYSSVDFLTMQQVAGLMLNSTITMATGYQGFYDEYCKNSEDLILKNKIEEARALTTLQGITHNDIRQKKEAVLIALSNYVATKLNHYKEQIETISSTAQYSTYPYYIKNTYPESSKDIIEGLLSLITETENQTYTIKEYETLYNQIERDIEIFESTKITETILPEEDNTEEESEEILFVYLSNGDVDAFTKSCIDGEYYFENGKLYIPLKDSELIYYEKEEYDSCSAVKPELPTMTSFKFNNKYNPNLHIDAVAEEVSNNMHFRLNAIGRWLTASFTLSDDKAVAYVDTVLQVSKETRQSFKEPVTYNVTYPGYNIIKSVKVQDEIWTEPVAGTQITDVALTADMLYTNKPSQESNEGLANLLDNNEYSIFHSTWGTANNTTVNVNTYITIDLPESLDKIQIYYRCRPQSGYNPLIWEIYASNDGNYWKLVKTLDYITDNMPTGGVGQEFTSSTIDLQGSYSKIKILQTYGEYSKNHLVLSELRIKKVVEENAGEPEKIQDAKYEIRRIPYGNSYKVKIDWLTDIPNSVPRIDIDVDGGYFITSKDYYRNAKFRISGFGIYDNFEDSVQIKGRGNSSWAQSKKPYRLKFAEKVKPFGLTKGKSWVLLANAQDGSLMANAISMKIGQMAGAEYTNHIIPVELYMNGRYMGNYMFTEKIGIANNSVNIDETLGHLLELDTNSDEEYQFNSAIYKLPVFVKEPDLMDNSTPNLSTRKTIIKRQFDELCNNLYNGQDIENIVDMDALAKFILANDLSLNQELGHPKSIFLFKENENNTSSKYKFGPIWDFDWGYGYESGHTYCTSNTTASIFNYNMYNESGYSFFYDLLNVNSFKKHYYKAWVEFINNNCIDELNDYIDHYYSFATSSFNNNATIWGYRCGFTEDDRDRHKSWIEERKNHIYNNLTKYDINDLIYTIAGDVNYNNQVTIHDVALITAYINGNPYEPFSIVKADCDKNNTIELEDARIVEALVKEGDAPTPMYWYNTPNALGEFYSDNITLEIGDVESAAINLLSYNEEQYKAIQFDISIPEGISLIDIMSSRNISGHKFSYTDKGNNVYRITAYSDEDKCFSTSDEYLVEAVLSSDNIINEENCMIKISNAYLVDNDNNELRMGDYNIKFSQATGIKDVESDMLVEGGKCISITLLEPQEIVIYSVDGRKIRHINAQKGTTRIAVEAGIYIINGEKVIVQ